MDSPAPRQTLTQNPVLSSTAAARNAAPILAVLRAHLPARGRVLEVAAGSGQHAQTFAAALPGLGWTPADPDPHARASIAARRDDAGLDNLRPPLALDCLDVASWPPGRFDAVVCINMMHISPWAAAEGLMDLAGHALPPAGLLALYGPFLEKDVPLAPSNAAFDESLRARDPAWGLRDRDAVIQAAKAQGLAFTLRIEMPANNLMLLFRRV